MSYLKLNHEQNIAAHHINGPMLVLAGPGSGKTHLLVERIRIMIEEEYICPENILVITFSQKSACEMKNRFFYRVKNAEYPVKFGTFHAAFFDILKSYYHYSNDNILTESQKDMIIRKLSRTERGFNESDNYNEIIKEKINYISAYKNFGNEFFEKSFGKYMSYEEKEEFISLYENYCKECRRCKKIDFDDMVLLVRELFLKHEYELRKWQKKYRYFLVDEFQDINEPQYEVLRLLAGDACNVFAVGDDDQSIYAFRGAKPSLMQRFINEFYGCRRVNLSMNYRCASNIIKCADNVIKNNFDRISRPMQKNLPGKAGGNTNVYFFENTVNQGRFVARMIKESVKNNLCLYDDIAVLYRSEHCASMLRNILKNENIPVKKYEDAFNPYITYFADVVLAYMKASIGKCSRSEFLLVINNPKRNLTRESLSNMQGENITKDYFASIEKFYDGIKEFETTIEDLRKFLKELCKMQPGPALSKIVVLVYNNISNLPQDLAGTIDFLAEIANEFKSIDDFVLFLEKKRNMNSQSETDQAILKYRDTCGVNLMTAHASKGLEFKTVIIIGLQEGLFPHHKSLSKELVEEERRLMYVAMTRAKENLILCALGSGHGKRVSRFVGESMILN